MTTDAITNDADVLDSRDIIDRIEELQGRKDDEEQTDPLNEEEADELAALVALAEEAEGYADDWRHGATLIRETYFTDYTEELLQDIGDLPKNLPGYVVIDWEATARNIQVDYTPVEFDGVTYWVR